MPEFDLTPEQWDVAMESCADTLVQGVAQFDQDADSAVTVAEVLTAKLLGPRPAEPTPLQRVYKATRDAYREPPENGENDGEYCVGYDDGYNWALQFVRDNILPIIGPEEK